MEFTARPVAPYLVPVPDFAPTGGPSRRLGEVHPEAVATAGARDTAPVASAPPSVTVPVTDPDGRGLDHTGAGTSPRLLELLALTEQEPELTALLPYLDDPSFAVRRSAVDVLTETVPPGTGPALAAALRDPHGDVRATAAASLRELVESLPAEPDLRESLATALTEDDPVVRSAALDVLRALRLGDAELFADALADPETAVRVEAVRALVSVDAAEPLSRAAADPSREVRVTVAKALANVTPGMLVAGTLDRLTTDPDALVRAAAFATLAVTGCPAPLAARAVAAQADAAWQVRSGAATALSAAETRVAVPVLAQALEDPNPDVRKAAVLALVRHSAVDEGARAALATATADSDADVRAYASRVL
jgi:HEAT repeat protein